MCVTNVQGTAGSCCQEPLLLESPGALSVPPLLTCDACCGLPGKCVGDSILRLFTGALVILYHIDTLCLYPPKFHTFRKKAGDTGPAVTQRLGLYLSVRAFGALSVHPNLGLLASSRSERGFSGLL